MRPPARRHGPRPSTRLPELSDELSDRKLSDALADGVSRGDCGICPPVLGPPSLQNLVGAATREGEQPIGKTAYRARVRSLLRSRKANATAASIAKGFRKVCRKVVANKGAHSGR